MKNWRTLPLIVLALALGAAICRAQGPAMEEDPFAPKGTIPFDVNIDYDLAKSPVKTIYVMPSSHWDREFTDPDDVERDQLVAHIDDLIETARAHPDFRWHEEAVWHIEAWLRSQPSPERQEALFSLLRSGQVSVGATDYMITAAPDEIVGRGAYGAAGLAERHNVKFETADAADYIGFSWAQVQPLARSGVKYLLNSHHITFRPMDGIPAKNFPFWWEGPDGSRLMVWRVEYTSAFYPYCVNPPAARFFSAREMGPDAAALDDMRLAEVALKHQLRKLDEEGYDKDAILIVNSHDNIKASGEVRLLAQFKAWNESHKSPQLRVATPEEFFRHMEEKYGKDLPVYRGEYRDPTRGAAYRDIGGRQAAADLVEAEKFWSFADLTNGRAYPEMMLRQTANDIFETASHGGGAWWASQLQTDYTRLRGEQLRQMLAARANYLRRQGLSAFGQKILGARPSFAVVNDMSWKRSGIVEIPVADDVFPEGSAMKDAETGEIVAAEWAEFRAPQGEGRRFGGGEQRLPGPMREKKRFLGEMGSRAVRFAARDIPPMGYKLFEIVPGAGPETPSSQTLATTTTLETAFFKATLSPSGQIRGLYDKKEKREIMAPDARGPFAGLSSRVFRGMRPQGGLDFAAIEPGQGATAVVSQGPVSTRVEIRYAGDEIVTGTVIVFSNAAPEIRFTHFFNPAKTRETGRSRWQTQLLSLPLSYESAKFQSRIQVGESVRDASTNDSSRPAGSPEPVSAAGALGWGAYFSDGAHGLFVSSREISEISEFFNAEPSKHAVARLVARPGEGLFGEPPACEFVLSTDDGRLDAAEIYRRSLSGAHPLRCVPARSGELFPWESEEEYQTAPARSFVSVDAPDVVVSALKRARGGRPNEYALRLTEIGGTKGTKARVNLPPRTKAAFLADQAERKGEPLPISDGAVSVELGRSQMLTLRLEF